MSEWTYGKWKTPHSPLPWRVIGNPRQHKNTIEDANGNEFASCWHVYWEEFVHAIAAMEANAAFIVEAANMHDKLCDMVNKLLPLAMAAGALDGKLKPIADACFKEATELLGNIVEVKDER